MVGTVAPDPPPMARRAPTEASRDAMMYVPEGTCRQAPSPPVTPSERTHW